MTTSGPQILKEIGIICGKLEGVADALRMFSERLDRHEASIDRHEAKLEKRIDEAEKRLGQLERGRGFIVGAATVVSVLIGYAVNLLKP